MAKSFWMYHTKNAGYPVTNHKRNPITRFQALPEKSVISFNRESPTLTENMALVYVCVPYQPEVHTMKVSDADTTGIDSTTTVADSVADVGRKGLKGGTWHCRFLINDADAQTLADNIATVNLQERDIIAFDTKLNPKYEPWDIITITANSEYSAQDFEVIGAWYTIDLNEGGGGASARLTLRKWTA